MKWICKSPGKKSVDIIRRDGKVISSSLTRAYDFVFKRAEGCYVWDVDGKKYLDFSAGVAVANMGHTNKELVKAIKLQLDHGIHFAFSDFYAELPVRFVEYLLEFLPKKFDNAFLSNSGTEAVECALKAAKWHTKKSKVIAFENCFHGRTYGSLSMTKSKKVQRDRFGPFLPVKHLPYAYCYRCKFGKNCENCTLECLENIEKNVKKIKKELAAIFFEPVQGEGGYIVPPKEFIKGLREICNKYNILLCDDEVQSGCYRTGKFLAVENFNVTPDIVCLSKAIGGGVPLGVTVTNNKIFDWPSGSHANTLGGNLLACAAGIEALKFMKEHRLGEKASVLGEYMLKRLEGFKEKYEIIGDVRGLGLMLGMELVKDKKSKRYAVKERHKILCKAAEKGLILLPAGISVIRLSPPLILKKEEADRGLDIIEECLKLIK